MFEGFEEFADVVVYRAEAIGAADERDDLVLAIVGAGEPGAQLFVGGVARSGIRRMNMHAGDLVKRRAQARVRISEALRVAEAEVDLSIGNVPNGDFFVVEMAQYGKGDPLESGFAGEAVGGGAELFDERFGEWLTPGHWKYLAVSRRAALGGWPGKPNPRET